MSWALFLGKLTSFLTRRNAAITRAMFWANNFVRIQRHLRFLRIDVIKYFHNKSISTISRLVWFKHTLNTTLILNVKKTRPYIFFCSEKWMKSCRASTVMCHLNARGVSKRRLWLVVFELLLFGYSRHSCCLATRDRVTSYAPLSRRRSRAEWARWSDAAALDWAGNQRRSWGHRDCAPTSERCSVVCWLDTATTKSRDHMRSIWFIIKRLKYNIRKQYFMYY